MADISENPPRPPAEAPAGTHVVADQSEVFAFLASPGAHGLASPPLRIDTHGAVIFLAGDNAYKVKRAVRFPFMDLSTLEKRRAACEAEIAVNAPNAPEIYLGAVPVTRTAEGLSIGGAGEPVEWLVHMRRFDENATLDRLAEGDGLSPALLAKTVRAVLASHERALRREGPPAAESLRRYLGQNEEAFAENPELFPKAEAAALIARSREAIALLWDLLLERGRAGFVRRCHGDLHLRNIVLLDQEPTLFDGIEFDESIANCDVLYDLAFLIMDIWERGLRAEANLVFNRYLWGSGEEQLKGLAALPFFLSLRAAIRAKVIAAALPHLAGGERAGKAAEARRYFAAAIDFLEPRPAGLVAIGGLSGTGKTTLAAALAPFLGRPPGAVHLRSDIERKLLARVGETDRLPAETYTQAASDAVYAALRHKARLVLASGYSAVVDAVHARPEERETVEAVAGGMPFHGFWLEAPVETLVRRVRGRKGDASDATEDVVRAQAGHDPGAIGWTRLDAARDVREKVADALRTLSGERRPGAPD